MNKILLTLLVVAMTGCTATGNNTNNVAETTPAKPPVDVEKVRALAKANKIDGFRCEKYTQVGTHIKKLVCSSDKQLQSAKDTSRALREDMRRSGTLCLEDDGCKVVD